jgi:hypothetical protein
MFYTLLSRVDSAALAAVLNGWLQARHGQLPQALTLDGKAVTERLAQVVSLVAQETGATVAVAPVLAAEKEHEVPAAHARLAATDLTDTLVSLDAATPTTRPPARSSPPATSICSNSKATCPPCRPPPRRRSTACPLFRPTTATMAAPSTVR